MHLSLWTIESREFIYEWSTKKFPKINIEVLSTWTNLHLFALDKKSKIINIESEDLNVISKEFKSNFFLLLLTHVKSDCSVSQSLLNYVLTQAQCVLSMFVNLSDCKSVGEYKTKVTESSWTICQLLDTINQDLTQVPWCILSEAPQIVIAYSTSLLQACLRESLPTPLACLVSRERQLVATPSWNNLTTDERICLTAFSRIHSNISDVLIRIPSMDEHTSYRLVQVELIRDVAILILCGSDLSIPELKIKVNNYWSPLISDLYPFQLENLLYASVEGIPLNLRAFYKHQKDKQFCVHGFLRLDVSMDNWINLTMKKLFLRSKLPQSQKCLNASYSVIFEKIHNISIIVYQPSNLPKVLILAFDGQVAHNDIRQLVSQVDTKLDQWLQSGNQI